VASHHEERAAGGRGAAQHVDEILR
jgi:hypothetical protein